MQGDIVQWLVTFHGQLHCAGGMKSGFSAREGGHDLVAYGLDQLALIGGNFAGHCVDTTRDNFARQIVPQFFIECRAAADIGKQDRKLFYTSVTYEIVQGRLR